MSLILNIDTALSFGSVSLSDNNVVLSYRVNNNDRNHAAWIHVAIKELMLENKVAISELKAVAVSHGPGSYTGLRIGLATAKGLCYALNIPLITMSTLEIIASAVELIPQSEKEGYDLICPMIDARRMEIYFALYDLQFKSIFPPTAVVLDKNFLSEWLEKNKILFLGNGSEKMNSVVQNDNIFLIKIDFIGAIQMIKKSCQFYDNGVFADVVLSEPLYIKEFNDTSAK